MEQNLGQFGISDNLMLTPAEKLNLMLYYQTLSSANGFLTTAPSLTSLQTPLPSFSPTLGNFNFHPCSQNSSSLLLNNALKMNSNGNCDNLAMNFNSLLFNPIPLMPQNQHLTSPFVQLLRPPTAAHKASNEPQDTQSDEEDQLPHDASTTTSSNYQSRNPANKRMRRRRTCTKKNCTKLAQGRSTFCFAHGGGYRCQVVGCGAGARGCTKFCIRHGGGLRCVFPGCKSSARGKKKLCITHGGGRRCSMENCGRSTHGTFDLCKIHQH